VEALHLAISPFALAFGLEAMALLDLLIGSDADVSDCGSHSESSFGGQRGYSSARTGQGNSGRKGSVASIQCCRWAIATRKLCGYTSLNLSSDSCAHLIARGGLAPEPIIPESVAPNYGKILSGRFPAHLRRWPDSHRTKTTIHSHSSFSSIKYVCGEAVETVKRSVQSIDFKLFG
jgi:hypothetical protein